MNALATFHAKSPKLVADLISDFALEPFQAAAIAGNAGHESGGLVSLQELRPTVRGSKGGFGWFQWTGPRRRSFEAWCRDAGLMPSSDAANYGYLKHELQTGYKRAIAAVKAKRKLEDAVVAFELTYEMAGVKAYGSRIAWAKRALASWNEVYGHKPVALISQPDDPGTDEDATPGPADLVKSKTLWASGGIIGSAVTTIASVLNDWKIAAVIMGGVIMALALFVGRERIQRMIRDLAPCLLIVGLLLYSTSTFAASSDVTIVTTTCNRVIKQAGYGWAVSGARCRQFAAEIVRDLNASHTRKKKAAR